MGPLHNLDFGVFWASWGGSGKERVPGTGSANHLMGSDGLGSVCEVWTEPVLGTGFRKPEVLEGSGFRRFGSQGSESYLVL